MLRQIILILLISTTISAAAPPPPTDAFVKNVVSIINKQDDTGYRSLLAKFCLENISETTNPYYDQMISLELKYPIPPEATISIEPVPQSQELPMPDLFDYSHRPDLKIIISTSKRTRAFFAILQNTNWCIYLPAPTPKALLRFSR